MRQHTSNLNWNHLKGCSERFCKWDWLYFLSGINLGSISIVGFYWGIAKMFSNFDIGLFESFIEDVFDIIEVFFVARNLTVFQNIEFRECCENCKKVLYPESVLEQDTTVLFRQIMQITPLVSRLCKHPNYCLSTQISF